ncbi:Vacuolar import and degradation protein 27 [Nosema bombycis CQ1]|uniref:Vacuolar import and degradation protein 27 n=1 Tax=Nosema bombycis (strain CQ1 / CVCC 102059) TaxID=578461 RepID=R0KQM4_NOSB1|nr:Vacuolar import and degradation protein 27 [Nosema bombycis CQ1]|eukprot:EOB12507.1 Vacuolar import and degradation protein 27 [Nosema bombycis CQ1]
MVFKLIKNIFSKPDTRTLGVLSQNKEVILDNCIITLLEDNLLFKNDSHEVSYEVKRITDLKLTIPTTLSFTFGHKKYKYDCKEDLSYIFKKINPLISSLNCIFSTSDFIYKIYEPDSNLFKPVDEKMIIKIIEDKKIFYLKIETEEDIIHFEEITTETQYYMDNKASTFVWSVMKDNNWFTFSMIFKKNLEYLEFLSKYVSSTYKSSEHGNNEYFEEIVQYDEDEEKWDKGDDHEDIKGDSIDINDEGFVSAEEDSNDEPSNDDHNNNQPNNDNKNELLVVGNQNAFVTRGQSIGIFRNTNNGLEFKENLEDVLEGKASKMIPHNKSTSLIYLDKNESNVLKKLDLERGEVVENWSLDRKINDYFDSSKYDDSGTLVGLSDYSVFRIDPRTKEKISEEKSYKTKNEFKCGNATKTGHVAVADKKGDLRLYDKIDKRAKSLLPGLGDEIKHVDVTSDGKHIICTCKNYLMLFTVEGDYKKPIGSKKPIPKRLTLKPEHLVYINEEINFTPAKFSTDNLEDSIITSTGRYVIKWNLKDVLKGGVYSYTISRCSDLVIADNFEFGDNESIIVTLPNDVRSMKSGGLKRPDKRRW